MLAVRSVQSYEKWSFFKVFSCLDHFPEVFGQVKELLILQLREMMSTTCTYVPNCFYFVLCLRLARRSVESYKKWSFYKYFYQLGLFPQVFSQVNEWPILELYEMIRVSHVVARPVVFILFDDRCLQGGVLKNMKNDHFS